MVDFAILAIIFTGFIGFVMLIFTCCMYSDNYQPLVGNGEGIKVSGWLIIPMLIAGLVGSVVTGTDMDSYAIDKYLGGVSGYYQVENPEPYPYKTVSDMNIWADLETLPHPPITDENYMGINVKIDYLGFDNKGVKTAELLLNVLQQNDNKDLIFNKREHEVLTDATAEWLAGTLQTLADTSAETDENLGRIAITSITVTRI